MKRDKYLEIAKKLKALADRGDEGEKYNAKLHLDRIMQEHNITIEEIEGEKLFEATFMVMDKYKRLFFQVCSSVMGIEGMKSFWVSQAKFKGKVRVVGNTTKEQEVDILCRFDFYLRGYKKAMQEVQKEYKRQQGLLLEAFIQKHSLVPYDSPRRSVYEMSFEEMMHAKEVMEQAGNLESLHFRRQLG